MPSENLTIVSDSCSLGPARTLLAWSRASAVIGIWRSVYRSGPIGVLELPNFDHYIQYAGPQLLMRKMASGKWEELVLEEVKGDKRYAWCHLGYGPIDGGLRTTFLFYLQEAEGSELVKKTPLKCGREYRPVTEAANEMKDVATLR